MRSNGASFVQVVMQENIVSVETPQLPQLCRLTNLLTEVFHGAPPCLMDGKTHLGSINSLSHASSVFSLLTHLKAIDSA